jgi:BTG family
LVLEAAKRAAFPHGPLTWPLEMILWIDPGEVMARIGERGSIFPVPADVEWLDIRPESTAKFNRTHFVPQRPSIYQRVVARNKSHAKLPSDELIRPIGIALRSNLKRLNVLVSQNHRVVVWNTLHAHAAFNEYMRCRVNRKIGIESERIGADWTFNCIHFSSTIASYLFHSFAK